MMECKEKKKVGRMSRFLRLGAFLSVLFFATNVFASGYTCPSYKRYTSCNEGYYLSSEKAGNSCLSCPSGYTCSGGTSQPVKNAVANVSIILNKNGGSGTCANASGTNKGEVTCTPGNTCTLPSWNSSTCSITNGKRIFKGWSTAPNATTGVTSITTPNASVTYYAVWVMPTCSATNGTCVEITTPSNNAPRAKITCKAGYSQNGGTNTTTSFTATGSAGATSVSGTCKARTEITVTFKSGDTVLGTQAFIPGVSAPLKDVNAWTAPVSSDYGWSFVGFATSVNSTTVAYTNGAEATFEEDTTLYGVWLRPAQFTYIENDEVKRSNQTQYYYNVSTTSAEVTSLTLPGLISSGYGWSPKGWHDYDGNILTYVEETSLALSPERHSDLSAWYQRTVWLVYNGNGSTGGSTASASNTQSYFTRPGASEMSGAFVLASNGFTRTGYTFSKWAAGSTSGTQYSVNATFAFPNTAWDSSDSYNMYAIWTQGTYTCAAGKYLNGATCTTCDAGYSCPGGTWTYNGGVQGRTACGGNTKYSSSGASSCSTVTSGYYTTGGTSTTRTGQSQCTGTTYCSSGVKYDCPSGYTANTSNGKTAASQCTISVAGGKYIGTAGDNSSNWDTCAGGTYKAAHTVAYGSTSSCSACTGRTKYSASGASSCSTVSTGYYTTGCNSSGNNCTGQSQCTGATYCSSGVKYDCPSGYTANTSNGKTAASQCQIYCAAGTRVVKGYATCTSPAGAWFSAATITNYGNITPVHYCMNGYKSSGTTAAAHDAMSDCIQTVAGGKYVGSTKINARYIKVTTAGSTANAGSHVVEIQAFASNEGGTTNLLAGKGGVSGSNMTAATDGSWAIGNYASGTMVWDMGAKQSIGSIRFALYTDGRTYHDVTVSVSMDNSTWTKVLGPIDIATLNTGTAEGEMIILSDVPTSCSAGTARASGALALGDTNSCSACGAVNKYSAAGASACSTVSTGYYTTGGTTTTRTGQSQCTSGTYCTGGVQNTCPSGYGASAAGSDAAADCYMSVAAKKYVKTANDSTATACGTGTYKAAHTVYYGGTSTCSSCPSGYDDGAAVATQGECVISVAGGKYIGTAKSATLSTCAGGTYKAAHTVAYGATSSCATCSAGYYCPAGASSQTACGGNTKYSSSGAAACSDVSSGYYTTGGTSTTRTGQTKCEAGNYCSGGVKTACGGGKYSAAGATSCSNITAGCYGTSAGSACPAVCGTNQYSTAGSSSCSSCPTDYKNSGTTAASHAGSASCIITVSGGYYIGTAGDNSSNWDKCAGGTYKASHTVKYGDISSCATCSAGYYCAAGASAQTACGSNAKYSSSGAAACSDVSSGYYTTGGTSTTRTGQTKCEAGNYCSGGVKTACGGGKYSAAGATSCSNITAGCYGTSAGSACPAVCGTNQYSTAGSSSCSSCPTDYKNSGTTAASHAGSASCIITVSGGHYIGSGGQNSGNWGTCAGGTYKASHTVAYGSTSSCATCSAGYYCPAGASGQTACGGNTKYSSSGAAACSDVSSGYYTTGGTSTTRTGQSQCTGTTYCSSGVKSDCPSGYTANTSNGKTAASQCTISVAGGKYIGTANSATLSTCAAGMYKGAHQVNYGSTSSCAKVDAGCYADTTGSTTSCPKSCAGLGGGLYVNSVAGSDAAGDCYFKTTGGKYLANATDTAQTTCEAKYYCPTTTLYYPNTGGRETCPDPASSTYQEKVAEMDWLTERCPTATTSNSSLAESKYQTWYNTGLSAITQCVAYMYVYTPCANFNIETAKYNSSTGRYDSDVGDVYADNVKAGYYLAERYSSGYCNTSTNNMLYRKAVKCPKNSYCPGGSVPKCSSGTYNDTWGSYACTSLGSFYTTTASTGSTASSQCYGATTAGKFVKTANSGEVTCDAGGYCPGGVSVAYGSTGGRTACPAGTKNASTGSTASSACTTCAAGTYNTTTGNTSCSNCGTGYYCTGGSARAQCTTTSGWTTTTSTATSTSYSACYQTQTPSGCTSGTIKRAASSISGTTITYGSASVATGLSAKANYYVSGTSCPVCTGLGSFYTTSAGGAIGASGCYGTTTAGKYIKTQNSSTQETCPAASYCPATKVYYGKYDTNGGRTACPSGYGASATGSDAAADCYMSVAAKKYVKTANDSTATACGTGTYKAAHTVYYGGTSTCSSCPSGYDDGAAVATQGECVISVAGGKYIGTAKSATLSTCAGGTYKAAHTVAYGATSSCATCSAGYYCPAGASSQTACGGGKWSSAGATSCSNITAGCYGTSAGSACPAVCGDAQYSDAGAASCSGCPAEYKNSGTSASDHAGSASCKITVDGGYYIGTAGDNSSNWDKCTAGTYKASHTVAYGSTSSCSACSGRTKYSASGAAACSDVSSGYYTTGCNSSGNGCTGQSQCVGAEYYCTGGVQHECPSATTYKRTTFPADYYSPTITATELVNITGNGKTSASECIAFSWLTSSRGKLYEYVFYNPSTGKYDNHRSYGWSDVNAGYYLTTKGGCGTYAYYLTVKECPEGSYCPGKSRVACDSSNQATVHTTNFGLESCSGLAGGFYPNSAAGSDAAADCYTNSISGKYVASANATSATNCAAGTYKGSHTVNYGSTSSCGTCANWTYSSAGAASCSACLAVESGWTKASGTGWESYASCKETKTGDAINSNCSAGVLTKAQSSATAWGSATITTALQADAGSIVNGQTCTQCSAGTYSAGGTATSCGTCANWTYSSAGAASCTACLAVPDAVGGVAWTKATGTGWTSYSNCVVSQTPVNCASGSVKRTQSSASAWGNTTLASTLKSNAGYYASTTATACTICPVGSYCPASATSATACAIGSYTNATGKSACTECSAGKTTTGTGKTSCDANCSNATGAHTWETPSWSANSVTNLCTVSKCNANTYYTATTGNGYQNTCTACGSNSSTSAGNTSTTCTCTTGYTSTGGVSGATTSTSGCSLISDIACAIGEYVPASSTTCSACTAGYYCPSSAKTYSYSSSIQGRKACAEGTYQPNTGKTSCTPASKGYYVSGTAKTAQTACTGATYAANTGQSSCTACPTATNDTANVSSYNYWNTGAIGDHTDRSGCNATFKSKTLDDGVMAAYTCYVDSGADTYGVNGTSKTCAVKKIDLKCNGGYYNSTFNNSSTATQDSSNKTLTNLYANACQNVGAGYWSANDSLTRTACASPLTTIGYGTGANEAEDCGRKLHAGANVIYLRSAERTSPSLRVKVGNTTFYGALSTSLSSPVKVKNGSTAYSVVNDWQ